MDMGSTHHASASHFIQLARIVCGCVRTNKHTQAHARTGSGASIRFDKHCTTPHTHLRKIYIYSIEENKSTMCSVCLCVRVCKQINPEKCKSSLSLV